MTDEAPPPDAGPPGWLMVAYAAAGVALVLWFFLSTSAPLIN